MKTKSILLIGNYPPPYGGVPRHLQDLVPCLIQRGWEVHILSGGTTGVEHRRGLTVYKDHRARPRKLLHILPFLWKVVRQGRADCLEFLRGMSPRFRLATLGRAALGSKIVEREGICVISAYNLYTGAPVGALLSANYALPLVVTNFGEIFSMQEYLLGRPDFVRRICSMASKLTSMTHHCAGSYQLLDIPVEVEVIPYGVDLSRFSPDRDPAMVREKFELKVTDQVVLFVGRMNEEMGLHTLLEAIPGLVQETNAVKVLIVGTEGGLSASARRFAEEYPGRVFVIPDAPLEELPGYYAASTVVVVPTQGNRACGSLAAAEAMATGKPVIASKVGGVPEFVSDGETGMLVPPEDPPALEQTTLRLLSSERVLQSLGKRAREVAESRHDKDKTNRRYERLFCEMAGLP